MVEATYYPRLAQKGGEASQGHCGVVQVGHFAGQDGADASGGGGGGELSGVKWAAVSERENGPSKKDVTWAARGE